MKTPRSIARSLAVETAPTVQLQYELTRRAYERGEDAIARVELELAHLRAKQHARERVLKACLIRFAALSASKKKARSA